MTSDVQTIDLTPNVVNLVIYQGDDTAFTVTFPNTVTMTGSTAKMMIKKRDGTTALTLQTGVSGIALSGQVFTVTITKAQTAALPVGVSLDYDFQWTNSAGSERTVVVGVIICKAQKTTS